MKKILKWSLITGICSLLILLMVLIMWLIINGNQEHTERWIEMWLGLTLVELMIVGIFALLTNWKDVKHLIVHNSLFYLI